MALLVALLLAFLVLDPPWSVVAVAVAAGVSAGGEVVVRGIDGPTLEVEPA